MKNDVTYLYETHLHTSPGSSCARVGVRDNLEFYKELGYDGVFITNHFLDAPGFNYPKDVPYEEQIACFFRDYEDALKIGKEIGIKVFFGAEINYEGADFLIYGTFYLHNYQEVYDHDIQLLPMLMNLQMRDVQWISFLHLLLSFLVMYIGMLSLQFLLFHLLIQVFYRLMLMLNQLDIGLFYFLFSYTIFHLLIDMLDDFLLLLFLLNDNNY